MSDTTTEEFIARCGLNMDRHGDTEALARQLDEVSNLTLYIV
jgi:hypothetical protein